MSTTPEARAYHVVLVTDHQALAQLAREILATMIPSVTVESLPLARAAAELPSALAAFATRPAADDELAPIEAELRRVQQLVAMGEATSHIQHTLNNPLTALLAEAQLLEMEDLTDEHRAAAKRIVELCRRMVGMVRSLDPGPR